MEEMKIMARNPIGPDGYPMERHHPGRLRGETELIMKTVHDMIHEDERDAVRKVLKADGETGNPGSWTGKRISGAGVGGGSGSGSSGGSGGGY